MGTPIELVTGRHEHRRAGPQGTAGTRREEGSVRKRTELWGVWFIQVISSRCFWSVNHLLSTFSIFYICMYHLGYYYFLQIGFKLNSLFIFIRNIHICEIAGLMC